ncbi:unnamed protein product [Meloidogyne enterolobii]|uniref:Uncharacterized protein n=1 Tax=Meloidogyne enterolobii TaxID=390850 RepID=A0ACB0Z3U1_MELEN
MKIFHRKVFKIFVLQFFLILVIVNLVKASSGGAGREIEEVKEDIQEEGESTKKESTTDYLGDNKERMKVFGKGGYKLKYQSKAKNKHIGEGSRGKCLDY